MRKRAVDQHCADDPKDDQPNACRQPGPPAYPKRGLRSVHTVLLVLTTKTVVGYTVVWGPPARIVKPGDPWIVSWGDGPITQTGDRFIQKVCYALV